MQNVQETGKEQVLTDREKKDNINETERKNVEKPTDGDNRQQEEGTSEEEPEKVGIERKYQ